MQAIEQRALPAVEVLPPGAGRLRVVACAHPFAMARTEFTAEAGITLAEILERAQPDPRLLQDAYVAIGDQRIPRENWHRVRPKPGAQITVRVLPGGGEGGNKTALRVVLSIAILVAATYVAGPAGLELTGLANTAFVAATPVSGALAINALAAP